MTYEVIYSADAERDFELIFDFLFKSYVEFGEASDSAALHAQQRLLDIHDDIEKLGNAPYCGTLHDAIASGLRHVTLGRAIVWFDINEDERTVRILAIFFGGQDHVRHMLARLLQ
ncbi:type II toxin-antitoxin system RelE/ParE family toxin [Thalassospira sp. HF15]|uniref:type II toxin-antitoxin system RelE/ParE family toxin n=1 Tax=Thalassospira sp. HF15 TaxID=2722755 RepID=UPI00143007B4|nr:type II toxin-antitoxin system RelE/ParE family toxin [Thalassospira sp. HF15]NIY75772.1 type II toxin-antitoxin system RelE/ParE family toxin [Thalassospira sp. HF15]